MLEKVNKACNSFGNKYIGWDGCWTIPVLIALVLAFIGIMGLKLFSVTFVIMLAMGGMQMYFYRNKKSVRKDEV